VISIRVLKALQGGAEGTMVQFGPEGGSIGRASTNTLALDDPDRTVSRVHAQVVCRDRRYFIIDRGSNPMLHNGQALGAGNEAPLSDGDRLTIGSFELAVQASASAAPAPVAQSPAQPIAPAAGGLLPADDDPFADLLAGLAPASAPILASPQRGKEEDLFADLLAPAPSAPPWGSQPAAGSQAGFDDFSDLAAPVGQDKQSIDSLFGVGGGTGGDPLALSPLADPLLGPNTAAADDPLAALAAGAPPPTPAPHSDHVPIGQFGFVPPQAVASEPTPVPASRPTPAPAPTPAAAPAPPATGDDPLLAAFLRGLQRLDPAPQQLTPALMERVGALLRTATQGALQLLLARQALKQELRAARTMIVAQGNNPLKFSPTVEVALAHLLGPGVRGFMPAEAAMRDAFDDLRAHQLGVMVGLRAALEQLIARFAPDELEKKIAAKSALGSLFAANRKARLWDQFVKLYAEIAREEEDDFHTLFDQAFTEAYEAQMARFKEC